MKKLVAFFVLFIVIYSTAIPQVFNNWRGPNRDGHYNEVNLLKEWPENGPTMLWAYEGIGAGFTSPIIHNGSIFITGLRGDMGYVYEFSMEGKLIRKFPYSKEIDTQYAGPRSTPTIADNLMYIASGYGVLVCLDIKTGKKVWEKDLFNDFDGKNIQWGFTENLIINGDMLYCAPGGNMYNVVALNRHNGNLIWTSKGKGGLSSHCSPLLFNHNGRLMLVHMMQNDIIGLDASSGELLWSHPHANRFNIHPNTPIYHNGYVYCFSGYNFGGVMLRISDDGSSVSKVWEDNKPDPQIGGAVLVNGYIYASGDRNRRWFCVDWKTGEVKHESREIDKGTVIAADNMLYIYTERGELALVEPKPGGFRVVSKTSVELGTDQHWAHLVIHNGVLYVRHGNALMAYDIRK